MADQSSTTAGVAVGVPPDQSSAPAEAIALTQQEAAAATQDQQPAAPAATLPAAEQMAAIDVTAEDRQPATKPIKSGESKTTKPAARAARAALAHRAARTFRARRTVATVAAQAIYQYPQAAYSQPAYASSYTSTYTSAYTSAYTWADTAARASQPVKRVQIKRQRTAKKPAPRAQSGPAAATAGLSGTQY